MAAMDVSVQLRLMDQLTGPAQNAARSMEKLKAAIQGTGAAGSTAARGMESLARSYDNLASKAERAAQRMAAARTKAMSAAVGLFTLGAGAKDISQFEMGGVRLQQVDDWNKKFEKAFGSSPYARDNAGNLQVTAEGLKFFREQMAQMNEFLMGLSGNTNQSVGNLQEALKTIVSLGVPLDDAKGMLFGMGKAATATDTELKDLSNTAYALYRNFKILPSETQKAWDMIHKFGKIGGFEMKDSARWFAELGAPMGVLANMRNDKIKGAFDPERARQIMSDEGLERAGNLAGWLQIARDSAANADAAANNLANVLQKVFIDETSKHFRDQMDPRKMDFLKQLGLPVDQYIKGISDKAAKKRVGTEKDFGGAEFDWRAYVKQQAEDGIDPMLLQLRAAEQVVQQKGTTQVLGQLWNDRQALMGMLALYQKYRESLDEDRKKGLPLETSIKQYLATGRDALGEVERDYIVTMSTLTAQFNRFSNAMDRLYKRFNMAGVLSPLTSMFGHLGTAAEWVEQKVIANTGAFTMLARGVTTAVAAIGALVIGRFGLAALQYGLATAGMAGISLLRVVPGMAAVVGALGAMSGPIGLMAKLGLLGAAGFFGWQHWDKLAPYMSTPLTYMQGVFSRLAEMFPSLSTHFGVMSEALKSMTPNLGALGDIGQNLKDGLGWLFGQGGDSGGFTKAKDGLMGLFGNSGMFDRMKQMTASYKDALGGGQGYMAMIKAWGALGLAGMGGFAAGAMAKYGPAGLISMLMALRSILFVAGLVVGALQVVASLAGIFLIPILERMLETKGGQMFLKGAAGLAGLFAISLFQLGWSGVKSIFDGFTAGFSATSSSGFGKMASEWNRLMDYLFPDEALDKKIARLTQKAMEIGQVMGSWMGSGFEVAASAIRSFTDSLKFLETNVPWLYNILATIGNAWGPVLLGAAAFAMLARTLLMVGRALLFLTGLSMIPALIGGIGAAIGSILVWGPIVLVIAAIAAAILLIANNWETMKAAMASGWEWITNIPSRMAEAVTTAMATMRDGVMGMINGMHDWFAESWLGKVLGLKSSKDKTPDIKPQAPDQGQPFGNPMGDMGFQPMTFIGPQIQAAGDSASSGIIGGGASVAAALQIAAAAIASAAASIGTAARAAPGIQARLGGALSDAPVRT